MKPDLEQALRLIAKHGTLRSNQLATLLSLSERKLANLLAPSVAGGDLVTCDILVPGQPRRIDYRFAADIAPFEVFRINTRRCPHGTPNTSMSKRGRAKPLQLNFPGARHERTRKTRTTQCRPGGTYSPRSDLHLAH